MSKSYRAVAASVAASKREHPEQFCPVPRCLWRTFNGAHCPRHRAGDGLLTTPQAQKADLAHGAARKGEER